MKMKGLIEHFSFHIARIILESGANSIFFENVPTYFKSETFQKLKEMLLPVFPEWYQETIDSYDLGAIETRKRDTQLLLERKLILNSPKNQVFRFLEEKK